jgi:hypothetical protein
MDRIDHETAETWRSLYATNVELLADIRAGRTKREYLPVEVEALEHEALRFLKLIEAYEAARDA